MRAAKAGYDDAKAYLTAYSLDYLFSDYTDSESKIWDILSAEITDEEIAEAREWCDRMSKEQEELMKLRNRRFNLKK